MFQLILLFARDWCRNGYLYIIRPTKLEKVSRRLLGTICFPQEITRRRNGLSYLYDVCLNMTSGVPQLWRCQSGDKTHSEDAE